MEAHFEPQTQKRISARAYAYAYALNLLGSLNDLHNVEFFIITKIEKFKSFFNPLSRHI